MNRNFFIRLAFAAHRVADALPQKGQIPHQDGAGQVAQEIRTTANDILADLILLTDKGVTKAEKKQDLLFQLGRQIDILLVYLDRAKKESGVNPENFSLLETEYGRIREFLEIFEDIQATDQETKKESQVGGEAPRVEKREEGAEAEVQETPSNTVSQDPAVLTERQRKILEFLRAKEKAQVWELQKMLPKVTKRTLRRDLDELLQRSLVQRKGTWNTVSYALK